MNKMAEHKKEEFSKKEQDLAAFAKAMAHPARIAILKVLAQHNECICGEIVEVLPLAQSTVSQHLKELKDCNLIQGTVEGTKVNYCIDPAGLEKLIDTLTYMTDNLKKSKSCNC